ncbi:MAG: DUF4145 domain-containing protein, partial [Paracoccaceae bacterium]
AVDWNLYSLYQDIYTARANDLGVLAAIAIRTCFDRASELKGIPTTASFSEKLDQLAKEQWISHRDRNALKIMVNAGSAAAHSGWRPKETELHAMQVILDGFLYRAFLQGDVAKTLESTVPDKAPTPAAERTNSNTAPK